MAVSGKVFLGADNITECLDEKYSSFKSPRYVIKTILEKELETAQKEAQKIKVKAIENSSLFCVMVFQPHNDIIRDCVYVMNAKPSMVHVPASSANL